MSSLTLVDTHCHWDHSPLIENIEILLEKANKSNIDLFFNPSVDVTFEKIEQLLQLQNKYKQIVMAVGVHPSYAISTTYQSTTIKTTITTKISMMSNYIEKYNINLMGEIGLDFSIDMKNGDIDKKIQMEWFHSQLQLAQRYKMSLLIHCRHQLAHHEMIKCLKSEDGIRKGIIHSYSGSIEQAKEYVDMGYKLGIGTSLLKKNPKKLEQIIKTFPLSSFVLETDAPYGSGYGSGSAGADANTPLTLVEIFKKFKTLRNEDNEDAYAIALRKNALSILAKFVG
ncbi:MAG: TatD family hydrolase [Oligoflexia bacterium]|nr:TatD family hydrolase [Oligoflexia bacterium]